MFTRIACLAFSLVAIALSATSFAYDWIIYPHDLTTENLNYIDLLGTYAPGNNGVVLRCNYPDKDQVPSYWLFWEADSPPASENLYGAYPSYVVGNSGVIFCNDPPWYLVESPTEQNLYSVCLVFDFDRGFIVGANGTILYGGGDPPVWNLYSPSPTVQELYSVCGDTYQHVPNTTWAVGALGTILDYQDGVWILYPSSPTTDDLYGVYVEQDSDRAWAWACGANGTILRWDGSSWSKIDNIPTTDNLYCIWGFADNPPYSNNAIFCVGAGGAILASEDLGLTWHTENCPVTVNLHGVGGFESYVWAVGDNGTILSHGGWVSAIQPQSLGWVKALYYGSASMSQKQPMSKKLPISR